VRSNDTASAREVAARLGASRSSVCRLGSVWVQTYGDSGGPRYFLKPQTE